MHTERECVSAFIHWRIKIQTQRMLVSSNLPKHVLNKSPSLLATRGACTTNTAGCNTTNICVVHYSADGAATTTTRTTPSTTWRHSGHRIERLRQFRPVRASRHLGQISRDIFEQQKKEEKKKMNKKKKKKKEEKKR